MLKRIQAQAHESIYPYTYVGVCVYTCILAQSAYIYIYSCAHTYLYIYVHICTYMYIYVHVCTYMYIYVQMTPNRSFLQALGALVAAIWELSCRLNEFFQSWFFQSSFQLSNCQRASSSRERRWHMCLDCSNTKDTRKLLQAAIWELASSLLYMHVYKIFIGASTYYIHVYMHIYIYI